MITLIQLGTLDYANGLRLQEKLVALRKEGAIGDVLLLLEHQPVITLGRNAKASNIIASPEILAQRGVELFETDRGGDVTFHGPGQIVGYPIFDLRGFALPTNDDHMGAAVVGNDHAATAASSRDHVGAGALARPVGRSSTSRKHLGAVDFVRRLEEVLIRTCADFTIPAKRVPGLTGVWTDNREEHDFSRADPPHEEKAALAAKGEEAKLAAIGIHISRFVTSHGFALNVNADLSYFNLIIPCGITSKPVTSMQQQLNKVLDLNAVAESISRNFGTVFQSQMLWLDSLDDLLGNTVGVPMKVPEELRKLRGSDDTYRA